MKPKHPHPKEMEGNGSFTSEGGLEVYKLLWGFQGRVTRLEVLVAVLSTGHGVLLAKVFGAF